MRSFLVMILIQMIAISAFSQASSEIDSLQNILEVEEDHNKKALILSRLADLHVEDENFIEAIIAYKGSAFNAEIGGDPKLVMENYFNIARYYYRLGEITNALIYSRIYSLYLEGYSEKDKKQALERLENLHELEKNALQEQNIAKDSLLNLRGTEIIDLQNKKRNTTYGLIAAVFVALGFLMLLVIRSVRKEKIAGTFDEVSERGDDKNIKKDYEKADEFDLKTGVDSLQLLKKTFTPDQDQFKKIYRDSFVLNIPRGKVTGNLFWFGKNNGKIMLVLAQCGIGELQSGIYSLLVNKQLDHIFHESEIVTPNMAITLLDQYIRQKVNPDGSEVFYGIKISVCVLDQEEGMIMVCSAGLPVFYVEKGEIRSVKSSEFPIANYQHQEKYYSTTQIKAGSGSMLYLCDDGFYNQPGGKGNKKFMRTSFEKLLQTSSSQSISEQYYMFKKVFSDWKGTRKQISDVLVVGLRV